MAKSSGSQGIWIKANEISVSEIKGAFYYAWLTGQRPAGLTEEIRSNQANREEWLLSSAIPFPNPPHEVKWKSTEEK